MLLSDFAILDLALTPTSFPRATRGRMKNEEGGLNDLNDWNVWNGSAEDIDYGGDPKFLLKKESASFFSPRTLLYTVALSLPVSTSLRCILYSGRCRVFAF